MKHLYVYPIEGLYHEFFFPNPDDINDDIFINSNVLKTNGYFWNQIFKKDKLSELINRLNVYSKSKSYLSPQQMAVLANKNLFLNNVNNALVNICELGNSMQELFSNIETLNIAIDLYNTFDNHQNTLTLQEGYIFEDYSYKTISDNCLLHTRNPYLDIIIHKIIPLIREYNPDLVFLTGKISFFNVALSKLLKSINPKIKICITRHSSEYFSLNKITEYLLKNDMLFSDIDYLVLEYFDFTEQILLNSLDNGESIETVPNIIYKSLNGNINKTYCSNTNIDYKSKHIIRSSSKFNFDISSSEFVDICFAPYSKCYWSKCAFCGINHKYSHDYCEHKYSDYYQSANKLLEMLPTQKYFWFIDEALTDLQLNAISDSIIKSKRIIYWQARTRIRESLLSDELIDKLAKSGLKELRLGLESASYDILKKMNKFENNFSLDLVKAIAQKYTKIGIAIHFPLIVGFPGESNYDRHLTYEFINDLKKDNPLISFNINILSLDISSMLFRKWYDFEIQSITLPCLPKYFIGNTVDWTGKKVKIEVLEKERNSFMREKLYKWYPENALTKPVVFYRLAESLRSTLISRILLNAASDRGDRYVLDNNTVFYKSDNLYLVYNFKTHHYMRCNEDVVKALYDFKIPHSISKIKDIMLAFFGQYSELEIDGIIKRFIVDGYLTKD